MECSFAPLISLVTAVETGVVHPAKMNNCRLNVRTDSVTPKIKLLVELLFPGPLLGHTELAKEMEMRICDAQLGRQVFDFRT